MFTGRKLQESYISNLKCLFCVFRGQHDSPVKTNSRHQHYWWPFSQENSMRKDKTDNNSTPATMQSIRKRPVSCSNSVMLPSRAGSGKQRDPGEARGSLPWSCEAPTGVFRKMGHSERDWGVCEALTGEGEPDKTWGFIFTQFFLLLFQVCRFCGWSLVEWCDAVVRTVVLHCVCSKCLQQLSLKLQPFHKVNLVTEKVHTFTFSHFYSER